jgi:hypothetical protein
MWFVVFDPEEEAHYLWVQSISLKEKYTLRDMIKHLPKGTPWQDMTAEEIKLHLPVSMRAQDGISWEQVHARLPHEVQERIEVIEEETSPTAQSPGADRQVKEFVAWAPYPSIESYQKLKRRKK